MQCSDMPIAFLPRRGIALEFASFEELRPTLLPPVQTAATHTKVGRDILIGNAGLAQRTNPLDVFLAELGRPTSATLMA